MAHHAGKRPLLRDGKPSSRSTAQPAGQAGPTTATLSALYTQRWLLKARLQPLWQAQALLPCLFRLQPGSNLVTTCKPGNSGGVFPYSYSSAISLEVVLHPSNLYSAYSTKSNPLQQWREDPVAPACSMLPSLVEQHWDEPVDTRESHNVISRKHIFYFNCIM